MNVDISGKAHNARSWCEYRKGLEIYIVLLILTMLLLICGTQTLAKDFCQDIKGYLMKFKPCVQLILKSR